MLYSSAAFQPLCCWVKWTGCCMWYYCVDWAGPSISGSQFLICKQREQVKLLGWTNPLSRQMCCKLMHTDAFASSKDCGVCSDNCARLDVLKALLLGVKQHLSLGHPASFISFCPFFSCLGNYLFLLFAGSGIPSWHTPNACGREQEGFPMSCALPVESSERGADVSSQSHSPAVLI